MTEAHHPTRSPRPPTWFGVRARWIAVAVVVVAAIVVAVWPRGQAPSASSPAIPAPAPNLAAARAAADLPACLTTHSTMDTALARATVSCAANGATVPFGSLVAGGPTLVNVWATWCPVCQTELPVLARYAATPGAVHVLTLLVQSPAADGLKALSDLHVRLPTAVDANGSASRALRLPVGLPASYLVRPDGTATLIGSLRVFNSVAEVHDAVGTYLGGQ